MTSLSGTFSAAGTSGIVRLSDGEAAAYTLAEGTGTFAGTVSLQTSGDDGSTFANAVTGLAAGDDASYLNDTGQKLMVRIACLTYTGDTLVWTLADGSGGDELGSELPGSVTVEDNLGVGGALTVTGAIAGASTLAITGASTLTGATAVGGTLGVTGASTLTGDVAMAADLLVGDNSSLDTTDEVQVVDGDMSIVDTASLGSEILDEVDFASHATWDSAGNWDDTTAGEATYTWASTQASTLTQTVANQVTGLAAKGDRWYKFTYTVAVTTAPDGDSATTITTGFAASAVALTVATAGTRTVYFKSTASPGDFVIDTTETTGTEGTFTIDDVTLKEVTGGDLTMAGDLEAYGGRFDNTLQVIGAASLDGATTVGGTLGVTGATTLIADVTAHGDVTVDDSATTAGCKIVTVTATSAALDNATTHTFSSLIPANSIVLGASAEITQEVTSGGSLTAITIGDGVTADLFGTLAPTVGSGGWNGAATEPKMFNATNDVVITGDATFTGGAGEGTIIIIVSCITGIMA